MHARHRRLGLGGALLVATLLLTGCGSSASPSPSSLSAKALLALALSDATKGGWVHEDIRASAPGRSQAWTDVIGTSSGRQMVDSDGELATVEVVGGDAYLKGNEAAIVHYFELPTKDPAAVANKWIEITPSQPGYSSVSAAVTLGSDFGAFKETGSLTKGAVTTLDGVKVIPILGHESLSGGTQIPTTFYVTASGTVLPVESAATYKKESEVATWSRWGQGITLVAPSPAIPITQLLG